MLSCTEIIFVISFFNFEKFLVKPGFPFTQLNQANTQNLEEFFFWHVLQKLLLSSHVIQYAWPMYHKREIIVLSFPVISFVIIIFVLQRFEIKSGFPFYWLALYSDWQYPVHFQSEPHSLTGRDIGWRDVYAAYNHGRDSCLFSVLNHCEGRRVGLSIDFDKIVPQYVSRAVCLGLKVWEIKRENLNMALNNYVKCILYHTGEDPGFSFRGGGGAKDYVPARHYERGTELTFGRGPGPA